MFTNECWPGDGDGFRGDDNRNAVFIGFAKNGGDMGDLGADQSVGRIWIEWTGSGGGFLCVRPAVRIGIGLGIEDFGKEFAVVLCLFPKVA